jgi:hypothetical protein
MSAVRVSIVGSVAEISAREGARPGRRAGSARLDPAHGGRVGLRAHRGIALGRRGAGLVAAVRWWASIRCRSVRVGAEGHEQFAIRGVPAGVFVVQEHQATAHHFDVRLEVAA